MENQVREHMAWGRKALAEARLSPEEWKEADRRTREAIFSRATELDWPDKIGVWNFWQLCEFVAASLRELFDFEDRSVDRRRLMQDWADYCSRTNIGADVLPLRGVS